jgi:phosphatidylinositol alpha-1,6-mannosyltransferase
MKIALITMDFPPSIGGVQIYLYEIAIRLAKYYDLTVVTPVSAPDSADEPFRRHLLSTAHPIEFLSALRAIRPDRILIGHIHPRLLLPAAMVAWGRYLAIAHGDDYLAMQNHWHTLLSNWLLRASKLLISTSKFNADRLASLGFSVHRIIPLGADPTLFSPAAGTTKHPPALLTVSRLVTRKGLDLVIEILPTLLADHPNLNYYIVGEGPDKTRLQNLSEKYEVSRAVHFLGPIPHQDLPEIYQLADIFVMPVREEPERASIEGFGIVYLEASASGLPVVAGKSGGTTDAVRDGETGFLIPPDDRQALLDTLQRLLKQPDLRRRMGLAGRRFVEEQMNWDRVAEQMRKCIEDSGV